MSSIRKFEDLEAWQTARELVKTVYGLCAETGLGRDFGLRDQIQRSSVSVMANIAEGHGRRGDQEFIQYLKIARGSCSETLSHAYVAMDIGMIEKAQFEAISEFANKTGNKLSGLIRYLRSSVKDEPALCQTTKRRTCQTTIWCTLRSRHIRGQSCNSASVKPGRSSAIYSRPSNRAKKLKSRGAAV